MTIKVTYNVTDVYMTQSVSPVYINISYSGGGTSGGGVWGTITGTLSNQTDLQTALDLKVPYSGATGDVSLGEYGINVGNVIYDTTPTGIPTEQGATYWDADAETVALIMNGTIQKIGEDTFYHVRNTTGVTIPKGTAVRFSGTTGNSGRLLIEPMLANGTYPSQYYMGITSEELVNNADGKVYHFGKMRNVNTSAFADGDVLYVSPSVAGGLTATAPVAPNNIIVAAAVVHAANNGTLMIRTTLGSNINADEGVLITTPTANQGLFYDGSLWVNRSIPTALGYTPANAATTLTINGVTYDLSTSRTWTISAGISGTIATGQVAYATAANTIGGSNNLFWDNANGRLGIGTNAPADRLGIKGDSNFASIALETTGYATKSYIGNFQGRFYQFGSNRRIDGTISNASAAVAYVNIFADNNLSHVTLVATNTNNTDGNNILRAWGSGNVLIQNGGTYTDLGYRLGVVGDTLLRGSGATSTTTALTVQNSSSTNLFTVRNDGRFGMGTTTLSTDAKVTILDDINSSGGTAIALRITSTFSSTSSWRGRIVAGGNTVAFLMGEYNSQAWLGGHNAALNAWAPLYINPDGTSDLYLGDSGATINPVPIITIKNSSGNTLIGGSTDIANAILNVESTTKGFLPPRMTTTQKNAIATPAAGLVVYDTTENKHYGYNGTTWNAFY